MIVATSSGWLISARLIRETCHSWYVEYVDRKGERRISKKNPNYLVTDNIDEATKFASSGWRTEE